MFPMEGCCDSLQCLSVVQGAAANGSCLLERRPWCDHAGECTITRWLPWSNCMGQSTKTYLNKVNACREDGEEEEDKDTQDSKQLKEEMKKPPDLMNNERVVSCLKDREKEEHVDITDYLHQKEEMEKPPDLINVEKVVSCLKDG